MTWDGSQRDPWSDIVSHTAAGPKSVPKASQNGSPKGPKSLTKTDKWHPRGCLDAHWATWTQKLTLGDLPEASTRPEDGVGLPIWGAAGPRVREHTHK